MLQDEFAVAGLMSVELTARFVCDQRLKRLLAPDEGQVRYVPAVNMQEIESVVDELHAALAIGRRLRQGNAWQSSFINAAQLAINVGVFTLRFASAATATGYLSVQSRPVRVRS